MEQTLRQKIVNRASELKTEADRLGAIADQEYETGSEAVADGFDRQSTELYTVIAELNKLLN